MNIVYPERWQRKSTQRHREAIAHTRAMRHLEEELRAAGFITAADLVGAGEFAIWQDIARDSRTL